MLIRQLWALNPSRTLLEIYAGAWHLLPAVADDSTKATSSVGRTDRLKVLAATLGEVSFRA